MSKNTNLFLQILFVGFLCSLLAAVNAINTAIESKFDTHREVRSCERGLKKIKGSIKAAKAAEDIEAVKVLTDYLNESKSKCEAKDSYPSNIKYEAAKNEVYSTFEIIMSFFFVIAFIPMCWEFLLRRIEEVGNAFRGGKK